MYYNIQYYVESLIQCTYTQYYVESLIQCTYTQYYVESLIQCTYIYPVLRGESDSVYLYIPSIMWRARFNVLSEPLRLNDYMYLLYSFMFLKQ